VRDYVDSVLRLAIEPQKIHVAQVGIPSKQGPGQPFKPLGMFVEFV